MATKKIVITGVTQGLGRALLEYFYQMGHLVSGCARSSSEIKKLRSRFSNGCFETLDVSDADLVSQWAKNVISTCGYPDLLINNAAIINKPAPLWEVPVSEFDTIVDINIKGVWNVICAFVPAMIEKKSGVIVNMSSGWGQHGAAQFGPYCTTKFAVEGMTQSLADELPRGMAAVAVSPGVINTQMLQLCLPDTADQAPNPDEWVKRAAPFLLQLNEKDNGKSLACPN